MLVSGTILMTSWIYTEGSEVIELLNVAFTSVSLTCSFTGVPLKSEMPTFLHMTPKL